MSLYLTIIILSLLGPLVLSFDKKVHFYTHWKTIFPAILIVGAIFIAWDIYFTENGIWGFNPDYLSGIYFYNLPLEECLFFFVVPYACVFIYEVVKAYFPAFQPLQFSYVFAFIFSISAIILSIVFRENWYTFSALLGAGVLNLIIYFGWTPKWYPHFVVAFIITTIPFLIVNGVLTGAATPEPIVWYSEDHIMGPRIVTIPVEDIFYNFLMLFPIVGIHEWLKGKLAK